LTKIILIKKTRLKTKVEIKGFQRKPKVKEKGNKQKVKRYNLISPVPIV
jgi:hypothetical protein